jgi:PKD repeat protein
MKKTLLALAFATLFASCKKDNTPPPPTSSFRFARTADDIIKVGVGDTAAVISSASNAASINWDLGDGRISTDSRLVLSYPKSGTYTVTLTAKGSNGKVVSTTKKVTVLDRVLKSIVIDRVLWVNNDPMFSQAYWPLTDVADIYVQIQKRVPGDSYGADGFFPNSPILYTSALIKNVAKVTETPLVINVSGKVILEKEILDERGYVLSLIARNASGEYMLFNNFYSGASQFTKNEDISKNIFQVHTSFFSEMTLNFDFE